MIKSVKRLGAAVLSAVIMLTAVATPLGDKLPVVGERVADVASAETYGDFQYSVLDDGTVEITKYIGSAEKVDIPEKIDGKSVTSIGSSVFRGCKRLSSITIPNCVTSIDSFAFRDCTSLKSITIPNSVTSIYYDAFRGCTSLTAINVANRNQNYVSVNGVLYDKDKTVIIRYPAGKKDKSYSILDGVTGICAYAFEDCANLESITLPDSVTLMGLSVFNGCKSLITINVAAGNQNFVSVNGVLYDKDKTAIIRYPARKKDKNYNILNSVRFVHNNAFEDCTNLTSITIPNSVTGISSNAFSGCSIKSITIPNSATNIYSSTFDGCISLTAINVATENRYYVSVNGVLYNKDKTTIIRYPEGKKDKSYSILDSVTSIESDAFGGCTSLTSIVIPKSVTSISFWALLGYDNDYNQIDNFKIYCYSGTAGEKYAKDNRFNYELITAEKPAKVTNFKVKSKTSTAVTMQWNKNSAASGYEIEQYKSGKWVNVAKITGNATTSYTVKGLAAGTAGYKFRMRAVKYGVYSDYTSALSVNTNPYGVGGFKCSSKSSTSVTLKWNKGTTASGYQLQQYKDGKWVTIYTGTKATNTSYTVKNLKAGTAGYRFRIRAYKTYGNTKQYGSWSGEVKVNANPYGVGGFKAKSISSTSVTLQWNKGTTASGYQLQQYKDGKWVTIYTGTKATNTSYTVKNLKAGTAGYRFRIRAYKTYGNTKQYGSWSSEVKVNTNPYGVGGFKAKSTTKNSITLGWNKGTTASGYQLQQYKSGKWVTVYTGTKATSTSYTVKSLKSNTSYKFRIRAYKTYGSTKQYGSWSKELTVRTKR